MRDTNLLFSDNVTITANGASTVLDIQKWPAKGAWVKLHVTGAVTGTSQTLDAQVQYCNTTNGTFIDGPAFTQVTATGARGARLCQSRLRYAKINYIVGGTSPSFAGVYAQVVAGPERDDSA